MPGHIARYCPTFKPIQETADQAHQGTDWQCPIKFCDMVFFRREVRAGHVFDRSIHQPSPVRLATQR
jgi:hypothetical protein